MKRIILLIALTTALPTMAQTAPTAVAPGAKITELQQTKIELYNARLMYLESLKAPTYAEKQKIVDEIVKANPGYIWHTPAGPQDYEGLTKAPQQAPQMPTGAGGAPPPAATPKK